MDGPGLSLLGAIVLRTGIVLGALTLGARLLGKRHIGEINLYDIILILMMANAVQNAMTKGNGALPVALVSSATLILLGRVLAGFIRRRPSLEGRLMGGPTVIVHNGQLIRRNLERERLTEDEVKAAVRKQGLADISGAKLVVLEMNGAISVVPQDQEDKD